MCYNLSNERLSIKSIEEKNIMDFANKMMELRKSRGWSQEELGERLGVTRQTVSKWELGLTTPEMEKLAAMSELFGITTDELIKGRAALNEEKPDSFGASPNTQSKRRFVNGEYKSRKTLWGMPLVHITSRGVAKGFVAVGIRARGIISIGLLSMGIVSVGLLSLGVLAWGVLAAGFAANGMIAAGVFALGGVAMGLFSLGGVSFGWLTMGGVSIGKYAFGGYAAGDIAIGGTAEGAIALGKKASGEITFSGAVSAEEFKAAITSRLPNTPKFVTDLFSRLAENVTLK